MLFRIVTVSNKLLDFVNHAITHYKKNLKTFNSTLELVVLRRHKKMRDIEQQKKYDTDLLYNWVKQISNKSTLNIVLDPSGKQISTEKLAECVSDYSYVNFMIGGDVGIYKGHEIWSFANMKLSISPWTLSHQVCIIVCAEQAWRILSILKGHPYHK